MLPGRHARDLPGIPSVQPRCTGTEARNFITMNLSKLLASRQALLRQTQLANLAFAYATLRQIAARVANANLRGLVRLRPADPTQEAFWASLTALEGSQSVIEEHFGDRELIEFADAMAYANETEFKELDFRLEELNERYVAPLRHVLISSGVVLDEAEQHNLAPDSAD